MLASVIGCTISVVNRYCAMVYGVKFRKIWTHNVSYIFIACQIIFPLAVFSFNFNYESEIEYSPRFNVNVYSLSTPTLSMINNLIFAILVLICTIMTSVMNLIIYKKVGALVKSNVSKIEKNKKYLVFIYMVTTTVCLMFLFIEQFARFIFIILGLSDPVHFLTLSLFWISPMLSLVQPITTLAMSTYIRQYFLTFYFSRWIEIKVTPTSSKTNVVKI
uniref:Serpentine receptor class gamma n=1 Tax=Parastrongyloides trichosuri TaxID=131310 RepID=A0A0N4ZXL8_PARTI